MSNRNKEEPMSQSNTFNLNHNGWTAFESPPQGKANRDTTALEALGHGVQMRFTAKRLREDLEGCAAEVARRAPNENLQTWRWIVDQFLNFVDRKYAAKPTPGATNQQPNAGAANKPANAGNPNKPANAGATNQQQNARAKPNEATSTGPVVNERETQNETGGQLTTPETATPAGDAGNGDASSPQAETGAAEPAVEASKPEKKTGGNKKAG